MIREQELHDYNKWLMEVWNPKQLYIPFSIDAPKAYLKYKRINSLARRTINWNTKITDSDFSQRMKNMFTDMELETFADIHAFYHKDNLGMYNFLKVRNFGRKSIEEIKASGLLY